jgi:hypothetical protein
LNVVDASNILGSVFGHTPSSWLSLLFNPPIVVQSLYASGRYLLAVQIPYAESSISAIQMLNSRSCKAVEECLPEVIGIQEEMRHRMPSVMLGLPSLGKPRISHRFQANDLRKYASKN